MEAQRLELLNDLRRLVLEVKARNNEQGKAFERMAKKYGEMRADQKAQGMIATSSSNITPSVPHTPSHQEKLKLAIDRRLCT
jgi:hypothetical protein